MTTKKKNIHYEKTADGRMEFIQDGKSVGFQKMNKKNELRIRQGKKPIDFAGISRYCWKNNANGIPLFVQIDMDAIKLPDDFQLFPQTEEMMLTVVQMVADGKTLRNIGQIPGMPPLSVIMRWSNKTEGFKDALAEARKSRAEGYHDAIEHVAFNTKEANARSSKVKIDALKFLASVNDRDRFGVAKGSEGGGVSVSFIVNTGITDQPIQVESKTIDTHGSEEAPADGDRDGLPAETTPAGDPLEAEKILGPSLP